MYAKIGIVGFTRDNYMGVPEKYIHCIRCAGGVPIILDDNSYELIDYYIDTIDGVMFVGGGDIEACYFGKSKGEMDSFPDRVRDAFEIKMCKACFDRRIPIFGICRGCQLINVALGGDIIQHVSGHSGYDAVYHDIAITKNSILHKIFNDSIIKVNSFHHQVCGKIANDLIVTAQSDDGYVEAVQCKDQYVHGVQFHPERMCEDELFMQIFIDFVNHALQ